MQNVNPKQKKKIIIIAEGQMLTAINPQICHFESTLLFMQSICRNTKRLCLVKYPNTISEVR